MSELNSREEEMAKMGRYCKAYPLPRFRAFSGWNENAQNARVEKRLVEGKEIEAPRELTDDAHLYLQENYTVTDGIFIEENIIFNNVSDEWVDFCKNQLRFEIPVYEPLNIPQAAKAQAEG
jgi:hypothetical protein